MIRKYTMLVPFLLLSFSGFTQIVDIPDPNFKNALVNHLVVDTSGNGLVDSDVDTNDDGEIQVSEALAVDNLDIFGEGISSLEGINSFLNLIYLKCNNNNIAEPEISALVNLEELIIYDNEIDVLDLSHNINLKYISCGSNEINALDLSNNTQLTELYCDYNNLSSLDVSANLQLERLSISYNKISELEVSHLSQLTILWASDNLLSEIDVSQNENLVGLIVAMNLLTQVDVSNNMNFEALFAESNNLNSVNVRNANNVNMSAMVVWDNPNLYCVQVDDEDAIYPPCGGDSGWCIDEWTMYEESCSLGTTEIEETHLSILPVPANNELNINTKRPINSFQIYSSQGISVMKGFSQKIDISALSSGLYFIEIVAGGAKAIEKFIKE